MNGNTVRIENRRARYDYFVKEKLECGIVLKGNEVKSIRDGKCDIKQAWCSVQNGQMVIHGMHIAKWGTANIFDTDENRERVLLLHRDEIKKLAAKSLETGMSLIPLKIYFSENGRCKITVGVCKGKRTYDKRESIKQRETRIAIEREEKE